MKNSKRSNLGFTLIASLLLLLLLSGMAIGLLMMVTTEGKVGSTDLQNDVAFHAAEGGMEKMYSDVSVAVTSVQSPTVAQICAINNNPPSMTGVTFPLPAGYFANVTGKTAGGTVVNCNSSTASQAIATPTDVWGQIASGPNQGLYAQIIPINLTVTAQMAGGQEVSMYRQSQIALIPVFQYGVFCEGDCAFFNNPTIDFGGRLHANGDLYVGVAAGNTITFHGKLEAFGNVVTNSLPNQLTTASTGDTGNVYIPTANGDCTYPGSATGTCLLFPAGDGSVTGNGGAPPGTLYNTAFNISSYASSYNSAFNTFSASVNHMIINGDYGNTTSGQVGTGAKRLSLPFVSGTQHPYELIRRETSSDSTALTQAREYDIAQIRVLLSDDPAEFQNGTGATDPNNVRLANVTQNSTVATQYGVTLSSGNFGSEFTGATSFNLYFATGSNGLLGPCNNPGGSTSFICPGDWPYPPAPWTASLASHTSDTPPLLVSNTAVAAPYLTAASIPTLTAGVVTSGPSQPPYLYCPPNNTTLLGYLPYSSSIPANCPASPVSPYWYYWNGTSAVAVTNQASTPANQTASWNLLDGWLRVEYIDSSGNWHPVTNEWLQLGFARGMQPPTANGGGNPSTGVSNPVNPNAILILQEPADRQSSTAGLPSVPTTTAAAKTLMTNSYWTTWGAPSCTGTYSTGGHGSTTYCSSWSVTPPPAAVDSNTGYWQFGTASSPSSQSVSQYNWYPINFYDAREGEPRDTQTNDDSCTTNGVMNAVEIDVGNLQRWLAGSIGSSGTSVDYVKQNGYILYFSDRRGMLPNPHPPMNPTGAAAKTGDSGLEDVINPSVAAGTPNGVLDTAEDTNQNGYLDNFGPWNEGLGFYGTVANGNLNLNYQITSAPTTPDPFGTATNARIASCGTTGRKNWVSGARHVLKLVDGSLGNLPLSPTPVVVNGVSYYGGFTLASENPVYVNGDYNSNSSDTFFSGESNGLPGPDSTSPVHAPASIIADTVSFLSDAWVDSNSTMLQPTNPNAYRNAAANTYYRVAVAAGKTMSFPFPSSWENMTNYVTGTDGGVGNFLRFLEDWSGTTMHYGGSLVSMFYSTYNTGMMKCCTYSVYRPPLRDYYFDNDFTTPQGLPPGTPMFRDVESLGYRQLFNPRTQ